MGEGHCHHTCLLSPSLAGTQSLVQGRNPARTESCNGNHTQHFLVIQDISSPLSQLDECMVGCRGQHCPCTLCTPSLVGVPLQKGKSLQHCD